MAKRQYTPKPLPSISLKTLHIAWKAIPAPTPPVRARNHPNTSDGKNTASLAVLRRAGFVEEGMLRELISSVDGPHQDIVLTSRVPTDP